MFVCKDCKARRKTCEGIANANIEFIIKNNLITNIEIRDIFSDTYERRCIKCGSTNIHEYTPNPQPS